MIILRTAQTFQRKENEGNCESLSSYVGRYNAAQIDLNRDFPDRFDDDRKRHLRRNRQQPETVAVMNWILSNPFVLSANLHGGAVVASYPYDNSIVHHDCCEDSPTPDNHFFKYAALTYAQNHPVMKNGNDCNETFPEGITNGAYWYELNGGMQDFNYVFSNCFEITLELSCCKFPRASELPKEWHKNKRSLIEYIKLVHVGVKGLVTDSNGYPIKDADVIVDGISQNIRTTQRGEYWRLLVPGNYKIRVEAVGYYPSQEVPITITSEQPLRVNFSLKSYEADEVRHPRPRPTRRRTQMTRKPSTFPHNNNNNNGYGYTRIQPQPPPYYYGNQYNNNNNIYNNPYYYYYTQYYANQPNRRPLDSRPQPSEPTAVYYQGSPYQWRPGRRRTSSFFY
ncbi:silver [Culex quinquefasciatus]|uniref:Silver n=1 Tax=Culex quinquefasciatus TaxID=7176 RepID=B0WRS9_CULQU|nr:silver [Culex quinquefasciatus]|eukprot:XP_001851413.1 silver [Culex quinquefasciatus]